MAGPLTARGIDRPRLSVIVPVHGTEEYLEECLASLVAQNCDGLEAIIVNDGSPDGSQTIIDRYCRRHSWFQGFAQSNQGPSTARNLGLSHARGEFITFLDSDDRLPPGAYTFLLDAARATDAEICVGVAESFTQRSAFLNPQMQELLGCAASYARLDDLPLLARDASIWNKLFAKALLDRESLRFPDGIALREDLHFSLRAYAAATRITVLPSIVYHYRARAESAAPSLTTVVSEKVITDLVWVGMDLDRHLRSRISDAVRREHQRGLCANLAYRLRPLLAREPALAGGATIRDVATYVQQVGIPIVSSLDDPEDRLMLLLIGAGHVATAARMAGGDLDAATDVACHAAALAEPVSAVRRLRAERAQATRPTRPRHPKRVALRARRLAQAKVADFRNRHGRAIGRELKLTVARVASAADQRMRPRDLWLIGERRGISAEDTGFHFFRYLRAQHPDLPAYFVTRADAKGASRARALGNVLEYGSTAAYRALLQARVIAYSDGCRDLFHRWDRAESYLRRDAVGCFLQHGVMGLSGMNSFYSKTNMRRRGELVQLFVASSPREKALICSRLGFDDDEVVATGLSRFDGLTPGVPPGREILLLFTWRDWLRDAPADVVGRSEYFARLQTLMSDQRLYALLDRHDLRLRVGLHFAMQACADGLRSRHPRVELLDLRHAMLQDYLARAALVVTDYSSVSFDAVFLDRPVIYYQFDPEEFHAQRGDPLLDPEADLPGEILRDQSAVVAAMADAATRGFTLETRYHARRDALFAARDQENSARLYAAIDARLRAR